MTTTPSPIFIDTNILVYANVAGSPFNQLAIDRINSFINQGAELWISYQIIENILQC